MHAGRWPLQHRVIELQTQFSQPAAQPQRREFALVALQQNVSRHEPQAVRKLLRGVLQNTKSLLRIRRSSIVALRNMFCGRAEKRLNNARGSRILLREGFAQQHTERGHIGLLIDRSEHDLARSLIPTSQEHLLHETANLLLRERRQTPIR